MAVSVVCLWGSVLRADESPATAPLTLTTATFLGTNGNDALDAVAIGPDGRIYVAGQIRGSLERWGDRQPQTLSLAGLRSPLVSPPVRDDSASNPQAPAANRPVRGGRRAAIPIADRRYPTAVIARLSPDGRTVEALTIIPEGLALLGSIAVNDHGVYVGGYAQRGFAETVNRMPGGVGVDLRWEHLDHNPIIPRWHWTDDLFDSALDVRGLPMVLRLNHDLTTADRGVILEGWQSTWHIPRPLIEDRIQPTLVDLLANGDLIVVHDGGGMRLPAEGERNTQDHFYGVPDHISRLSPDLTQRRFHRTFYTPPIDPEKASRHMGRPWTMDTLGQTRAARMRVDRERDVFYIAGWSPTQTRDEPWWSPFLVKFDSRGQIVWRAYNPNPMSGVNDRMGTLVADSAVRSVAVDRQGDVLVAAKSDGGNSVLRWDPADYTRSVPEGRLRGQLWGFRGRTLFWGPVVRLDGATGAFQWGDMLVGFTSGVAQAAWPVDLGALGDDRIVVIGRQTQGFSFTRDAWDREGSVGFVRLYDREMRTLFSTAVADADLRQVAVHGNRAVAVGRARSGSSPTQHAVQDQFGAGSEAGYLIVIDLSEGRP